MRRKRQAIHSSLLALVLLFAAQSASAIVTVGPAGSGCSYTKIQDAIDVVLRNERDHPDEVDPYIGVAGDNFYNEALVIDSGGVDAYVDPFGVQEAFVQIYGNYDQNCNDLPVNTTASVGAGGSQSGNSVIEVRGGNAVRVVLNHFVLTDGSGAVAGGGINFHADAAGYLDLSNVDITGNQASFGGGISVSGHAPGFTLALHPGVTIENNTADNAGGGLYLGGETFAYATEGNVVFVNNTAGSDGGGIAFEGHGNLDLGGVQMAGNHAANGGAILVNADSPSAINLYDGVFIAGNTADQNGGGMQIGGQATLTSLATNVAPQIFLNKVLSDTGAGGGIDVRGPAHLLFNGAVYDNSAGYGGGISALAGDDSLEDVYVSLTAANPSSPVSVSDNAASHTGGGIFVRPGTHFDTGGDFYIYAAVCAQDFLINGNTAAQGTAIYADEDPGDVLTPSWGSSVALNGGGVSGHFGCPAVARACAAGVACNQINDNYQTGGSVGDGATILVQDSSSLVVNRVTFQGNQGGHVLRAVEDADPIEAHTLLMTDNQVDGELIHVDDGEDDDITITDSTIAHNAIAADHVIRAPGIALLNTIIAEDVTQTVDFGGNDEVDRRHFEFVLTNPADTTLAAGAALVLYDAPWFVDVAARDYHLAPYSPGLDFAPASDNVPDLDKNPRNVDLAQIADVQGPRDLGPYELQSIPTDPPPECNPDSIFCNGFEE
ncbi:MAG TPA: hypothetical protein VKB52_10075 [Rhodanobacteraceae bacterium]|nr:hypothetical protein [Rhodanobacteraceae bacterium]